MSEQLKPCPFCGGAAYRERVVRKGYENDLNDADAWAFFIARISCAAQGGWAKSESGAVRWWNMRTDEVKAQAS